MAENTLYEFYTGRGQRLPSVSQRQSDAAKAGITGYTGTAEQNNRLLGYLRGNMPTIPATDVGTQKPLTVPSPYTNRTRNDRLGSLNAGVAGIPTPERFSSNNTPEQNRSALQEEIYRLIGESGGQADRTQALQNEYDIAGKMEALNRISGQYTTKERFYENKSREARKNLQGKFGGAVEQDIENISRMGNQELADLAIQKSVALGDLQTAQDIVDAKIKAEFEPLDNRIKSLQNFMSANLNDLSDSEKIALQKKIDDEAAARDFNYDIRLKQETERLNDSFSGGSPSAAELNLAAQTMQQSKGADGYVDPTVYKQTYDEWVNAGYDPKNFLKKFPPSDWINPTNTWLPVYLRPKSSTDRSL